MKLDLDDGREIPDDAEPVRLQVENLTDLGNARRLVRLHGSDLRFVHAFGRWFWWNGVLWREDQSGEIMRRAKDVPRDLYACAAVVKGDEARRELAAHARSSESEHRLRAMCSLAQSEPGIPAAPDEFDSDPWTLNTPKGLADLRTGELAPHSRDAMCSKVTGAGFEPGARSELWERCLERWLPDADVRAFVQRAVGLSLIGEVLESVLLILFGAGANGKSVFMETVRSALGDYALQTPAETLIANRRSSIPNDVARLRGARLVSASESEENRHLAEAKVKALTGGDTISARFMRAEWFEFRPTFTVWLLTNHKPVVRGSDEGIWRRIRLVPFTVTIPESERDGTLLERLRAELPAVLAWAVEGCLDYRRIGLTPPSPVVLATDEYRRESDLFGEFLDERCTVEPGRFASSRALYDAFREWAKAAGEESMTRTAFGKKLTERGFDKARAPGGGRGWGGISVNGSESE
ncbi:MAG: phage/plasmid primase, P4 family [Myxococcota bacterium]